MNLIKISVSGSNPHIHNPGGDPVPGWAYNFRQSWIGPWIDPDFRIEIFFYY